MQERRAIAIDGPVAVGKTVVGRLLARRLGFRFLDTGVMYRAVTWAALEQKVPVEDTEHLTRLAQELHIQVQESGEEEQVLVNGKDVTGRLRSPAVERTVSPVAQVPGVRQALVSKQRAMARGCQVVMVGRDIGTVVLPDATLKVFLEASVVERARRRYQELRSQGQAADLSVVQQQLEERDRLDTHRAHSPLSLAPNACRILTDGLAVENVVNHILSLVKE